MRCSSPALLGGFLTLCAFTGAARAQLSPQTYQSPITVLESHVTYTVAPDGTYVREETRRERINVPEAVQAAAQTYLPFNGSLERLEVLEAYTETPDGKQIPVEPDKIITQQSPISTAAPAFGDLKITAIVFPQIAPGAIKVHRERRTRLKPLFAGAFGMVEVFPPPIAYGDVRVTLVAPANLPMRIEAQEMKGGVTMPDRAGEAKWTWTLENTSAQAPEPNSVSPVDYGPRIAATTFTDFAAAAAAYTKGAEPKARVTPAVQMLADELTAGVTGPRAQAKALYEWVAGNIRYVALAFGLGGVVPRDSDEILQSRYGDCKDHVTLLSALLAAKGIESHAVLINAANSYWRPSVPVSPGIYNHAITYVPSLDLYLDSTAQVVPFGLLPFLELGKAALVTGGLDGGAGLVKLPTGSRDSSTTNVVTKVVIADDGTAQGEATWTATGVFEVVNRMAMRSIPPGQENQVANRQLASAGQTGQAELAKGDPRNLALPLTIKTKFSLSNAVTLPGPGAFAVPLGVPGPAAISSLATETALPARHAPYICGASSRVETTEISLPAGVKIATLPKAVEVSNGIGSYKASYSAEKDLVRVRRELVLDPPAAPVCSPKDYEFQRELGQAVARDVRAQLLY